MKFPVILICVLGCCLGFGKAHDENHAQKPKEKRSFLSTKVRLGAKVTIQAALESHFREAGIAGTFACYDPVQDTYRVYNEDRAFERFLPASTFKVVNALIAFDTGAVIGLEEVIPYGGTREYFKNWEKDMTIAQAMKASNVAVFHTIAKRIGLATYREKLTQYQYGNADPGASIDNRFWLTGPLKTSALEQVEFLRNLTSEGLPVKQSSFLAVRSMIEYEKTDAYTIFAKTGWAGPDDPQIGWWVGWVEMHNQVHPFALNIDIQRDEDAPKRMVVGKACLSELLRLP